MRTSLALLSLILAAPTANAFRGAPPTGRAGEPPDGRTCAGCHSDFSLNSGDVTLSLTDESSGTPMSGYEPGISYDLRFDVSSGESGRNRWGFELIPLTGESMAGEFSAGPSSALQTSGGRTYLAHSPALTDPTSGSWSFAWTAPPADVGDILVWACGNAANGDSDNDGDYIECTNFLLSPGAAGGRAVTRLVRWTSVLPGPVASAFDPAPCTTPSDGLRLCEESALLQESLDGSLPISVANTGSLVLIEHDSDTTLPGSDDLLIVRKDPDAPGALLIEAL